MPRVDFDAEALPARLTGRDQWVCWREAERDGKPTKLPVDPDSGDLASTTDDRTWTGFEQARAYADETPAIAGLGFVFTAVDPFVGVDLDDCRDPDTGDLTDEARQIVERLDSYTEVSPSGTGVHVIVEGELPGGRNRAGDVEIYAEARYFTMTGAHLSLTPTDVAARSDELAAIHANVIANEATANAAEDRHEPGESPPETMGTSTERSGGDQTRGDSAADPSTLSDEELLEQARAAANGAKFSRLWRGDTSGYPSHSEADMALCCLLAFWTGGDAQRMDRLFRESGLTRPKWDEVHYADGRTYGEATIERACRVTSERYEPERAEGEDHGLQHATKESGKMGGARADDSTVCDGTVTASDPPADASAAHLREANAVLRERVHEQQARIETLEAQLADGSAAAEGTTHDGAADAQPPSVVQRLRGVFTRRGAGSTNEP